MTSQSVSNDTCPLLFSAASSAAGYLLRCINEDGSFIYEVDALTGTKSDEYNMLRHCGVVYSLLQWHATKPSPDLVTRVTPAVIYLLRKIKVLEGRTDIACITEDGEMKLGGAGLAILALLEFYKYRPSQELLSVMQQLANFIVWMQQPSGQYHSKWLVSRKKHSSFVSVYYPGEAMLALVRLNRLDQNPLWLQSADLGMRFLSEKYSAQSATERIHDHWLAMALAEMQQSIHSKLFYREYWLIALSTLQAVKKQVAESNTGGFKQYTSAQMATRGEALVAALSLAVEIEDEPLLQKATLGAWDAATYCLRCQLAAPQSAAFNGIGGITKSLKEATIRIDYVQHTLSVVTGLLQRKDLMASLFCRYNPAITENYDLSVILCVPRNGAGELLARLGNSHGGLTGNGLDVVLLVHPCDAMELQRVTSLYPAINWIIVSGGINSLSSVVTKQHVAVIGAPGALPIVANAEFTLYRNGFPDKVICYKSKLLLKLPFSKTGKTVFDALQAGREYFLEWCKAAGSPVWEIGDDLTAKERVWRQLKDNLPVMGDELTIHYKWNGPKPWLFKGTFNDFERFQLGEESIWNTKHRLIVLVQARNESEGIASFLAHLVPFADGVILLDDSSTDGTYEAANAPNLLLKVRYVNGDKFDDLRNRNTLLKLSTLFASDWLMFLDVDEFIASPPHKLHSLFRLMHYDSISFPMVHLWDSDVMYRTNLPEGRKGVFMRYRMFRNQGYMRLPERRPLHFKVVPFKGSSFPSDVLLVHRGLCQRETRDHKFQKYSQADPGGKMQGYGYDYLLDDKVSLAPLAELMERSS